jgi:hypothetical protein|tara:strand:- start:1382 stop:1882 length:501 start_codon:yes stop_codon:yes gene_type:complete
MTKIKNKNEIIKFTPKQQKFIDKYCSNYGIRSATWCAIQAGYDRDSAHVRANELLDWRKNKRVAHEIEMRLAAARDAWEVTRDKHEAELQKIRDAAMEKGQYGVAAKCAELRGRLSGLYVEKLMNLNATVSEDEMVEKFKKYFDSEEEFKTLSDEISKTIFTDDDK